MKTPTSTISTMKRKAADSSFMSSHMPMISITVIATSPQARIGSGRSAISSRQPVRMPE